MRILIRTWRALRVDVTIDADCRAKMEQQTAQEVLETHQALAILCSRHAPRLSTHDKSDVAHILSTIGRDGA